MILETFILAGLAKLGCVVTAVKTSKRKKQTREVVKKRTKPMDKSDNKREKTQKSFTGITWKYQENKFMRRDKIRTQ